MKTQNCTFGIIFYLKKQKTTVLGKAPIYARVTVNGRRTEILDLAFEAKMDYTSSFQRIIYLERTVDLNGK